MKPDRTGAPNETRMDGSRKDELVAALWARDIRVFPKTEDAEPLTDSDLIRGLMTSAEARFQLAVIPLLLGWPTCDAAVMEVLDTLSPSQYTALKFYYQAATYLQCLERERLTVDHQLRDHFSAELLLPAAAHLVDQPAQLERALQATARLQARATGLELNWVEAYKKAARFALRETGHGPAPHRAQPPH